MLIYRAINTINGKSYIGKTEKSLATRRDLHLATAKQKSQFAFHKAIVKYSSSAFEWQVLDTAENLQDLNQKEQHYISLYESFGPKGYNMTAGGEGQSGWVPSEQTRQTWSQQRRGKSPWNKGMKNYQYTPVTEEQKQINQELANQKRSQALKGRKPWNKNREWAKTVYRVVYKDGTVKTGTRIDLELPKSTIDTMFRDRCGSRKYNIEKIERVCEPKKL
jgi:group I intron endonuclease